MNTRRWRNITEARRAYESAASHNADAPIQAFLEVSARCNLRCAMCAINYDSRYKSSAGRPPYFTPDLFARLRPIFPSLLRAYLFGLGEPMLNPHLVDYAAELAQDGVDVAFTTNATLIDEDNAEAIASARVSRVTVSIDGARAETYEAIRVGAKFDRVMRGIRALADAGRRHGRPTIALSFVAMKTNLDDIPRLVDLGAEIGAVSVHVEPLLAQVGDTPLDDHYARENLGLMDAQHVRTAFDTAVAAAAQHGIRFSSRFTEAQDEFDYIKTVPQMRADRLCSEPWSTIWITAAGEVRTCCLNDTSFGNLFEQTFDEIWNGPHYRRFREQHARREAAEGCANCVRNGRVQASEFFTPVHGAAYRPYFEVLPESSPDDDVVLNTPAPGATAIEPLTIEGSIGWRVDPREIDVMIDYTPLANLDSAAQFRFRSFELTVPTEFLTEGAHVLWLRGRERGYGHREFHFWRPTTH